MMKKTAKFLLIAMTVCMLTACGEAKEAAYADNTLPEQKLVQPMPINNTVPEQKQEQLQPLNNIAVSTAIISEANREIAFEAAVSWVNCSEDDLIMTEALNQETLVISSAHHLPLYKCTTFKELEEFKEKFADILTFDSSWDEIPSFEDTAKAYTEEFFATNDLLLVYVTAGSCTPRYEVESVLIDDSTLSVNVECTYNPEVFDCAMAGWMMLVSVSKEQTKNCDNFDAVMK